MEEILGWYGLQAPVTPPADSASAADHEIDEGIVTPSTLVADLGTSLSATGSTACNDTSTGACRSAILDRNRKRSREVDLPLDLTSTTASAASSPDGIRSMMCPPGGYTVGRQQNKKLVGIRYLFPAFDERTTLLDRARVWVARHDHKYFVDWTEDQLKSVDSALRPYSPITRDVYKLHMNRSEYCRNVKLKYCLLSDSPWAVAFRERLAVSPSDGGFTGLCQAKIAAAELWRKYSENYRSHQARHTPPGGALNGRRRTTVAEQRGGRRHQQHQRRQLDYCNSPQLDYNDDTDTVVMKTESQTNVDNFDTVNDDIKTTTSEGFARFGPLNDSVVDQKSSDITSFSEKNGYDDKEQSDKLCIGLANGNRSEESTVESPTKTSDDNNDDEVITEQDVLSPNAGDVAIKPEVLESSERNDCSEFSENEQNNNIVGLKMTSIHGGVVVVKPEVATRSPSSLSSNENGKDDSENIIERSPSTPPFVTEVDPTEDQSITSGTLRRLSPVVTSKNQFTTTIISRDLELPALTPNGLASSAESTALKTTKKSNGMAASQHQHLEQGRKAAELSSSPVVSGSSSPPTATTAAADYRRSERGLSFLFPSFADHHGMSLIDKVRVTVARHKNNYFLGWSEEQLRQLDPIVRPRLPVTPAVYREYCHRNAMKYDSNLQFACESPDPWAVEFRNRLAMSPADGGFTSLCEVKLEAGRLWREHSGKYRMHNIVKWQMGMNAVGTVSSKGPDVDNNATTTATLPTDINWTSKRSKKSRPRRILSDQTSSPTDPSAPDFPAVLDLSAAAVSSRYESSPTGQGGHSLRSSSSSLSTGSCEADFTNRHGVISQTSTSATAKITVGKEMHQLSYGSVAQSADTIDALGASPLDMTCKVDNGRSVPNVAARGLPTFVLCGTSTASTTAAAAAANFPFFPAGFQPHPYPGIVFPTAITAGSRASAAAMMNSAYFDPARMSAEFIHAAALAASGVYRHPLMSGPLAMSSPGGVNRFPGAVAPPTWGAMPPGQAVVDLSDGAVRCGSSSPAAAVKLQHRAAGVSLSPRKRRSETTRSPVTVAEEPVADSDAVDRHGRTLRTHDEEIEWDHLQSGKRRKESSRITADPPTTANKSKSSVDVESGDDGKSEADDIDADPNRRSGPEDSVNWNRSSNPDGCWSNSDALPSTRMPRNYEDDGVIDFPSVISTLWSFRDRLHKVCDGLGPGNDGDDLARRWPRFDQSLVDVLETVVGPNYALPVDVGVAAVDLVLAYLQRHLSTVGENGDDDDRSESRCRVRGEESDTAWRRSNSSSSMRERFSD